MLKAILVDIDNTLLDFNACTLKAMKECFSEYGLSYKEEYYDVFRRINNAMWEEVEKGTLTVPRLYEIRWNTIFSELGIVADGISFEKKFHWYIETGYEKVEGAEELLSYLSEKYYVAAASNAPFEQQKGRLFSAGLLPFIKELFVSEKIGAQKPSPEFFDHCIGVLGIPRDEIIIIGDSISADIKGGIAAGIKTCWFNPSAQVRPEGVNPDFEVSSLEAIKNIL
jgi:YjjG family noncanonical pyrimidine nucleotidase